MNVGTLYELLDRLPERCDYFTVRFTLHDRSEWYQTECWHVDDDDDLILTRWYDDDDHDAYTVDRLKDLLDGYWNDECDEGQEVYVWRDVYFMSKVKDEYDDYTEGDYYDILDDRFEINWKRERVDVFIEYN